MHGALAGDPIYPTVQAWGSGLAEATCLTYVQP